MNRLWRIAHWLILKGGGIRSLGRILELINHIICGCSISASADIGKGTIFFHRGIGCVVHPGTKIGENCKIFQNVTIGSKWSEGVCEGEAPRIGDGVLIGAGAVILGDISIGNNVIIGANAVVLNDVPANSYAVGIPAKIRKREV